MKTQLKLALIVQLMMSPSLVAPSFAQGMPGAPAAQGPIDIQANEQEFAENQVLAKGNVRVKYKDSVVLAPLATLFKDAGGNPQKAIFTGHPHLTQGNNKIDAETLTFEMANSKIIAEGRAHSEVVSVTENKPKTGVATKTASAVQDDPNDDDTAIGTAPAKPVVETIVTDSDRQEYDRATGKFDAIGHVRVIHGNINVTADRLSLVYGLDNKPETAVFTGNVAATQDKNKTLADSMTYSLVTKRLQATGHVKSTVVQDKKPVKGKTKVSMGDPFGMPSAEAAAPQAAADDFIVVTSEAQEYSRDNHRMSATGNVKVFYQDLTGSGPACVVIRDAQDKIERVVFSGRSQISQPGKRWIADHIQMTIADKKVLAYGNTKALILQQPKQVPAPVQMQLATPHEVSTKSLSSTKVDTPK